MLKRKGGAKGRRQPPSANLTGRAGACRILGLDKRQLRRLEDQGVVQPSVVEPDGVRWFEVDSLRRLAVAMQKAAGRPRRRARAKSSRPDGVERVTGAETRQINRWFADGLEHAEVVSRSGKTNETIRYLFAQYVTPSGSRLRATPAPSKAELEPDYYPERDVVPPVTSSGAAARRAVDLRGPVKAPAPPPARTAAVAASRKPTLTQVPDSWFTDPLPPVEDDDD